MPNRRRVMAEINIVPYVDIMLVLLVIFMVTAPLVMHQYFGVKTPKTYSLVADVLGEDMKNEPLVLSIIPSDDESSVVYYLSVQEDMRFEPEELASYMNMTWRLRGLPEDHPVQVAAAGTIPYSAVWEAIEHLKNAGVEEVQLVGEVGLN